MCKKTICMRKGIDPCMKNLIKFINDEGYETIASCCGHGKYPITIIIKSELYPEKGKFLELLSMTYIKRKKRIYKKDKQGYYYIPEVIKNGQ